MSSGWIDVSVGITPQTVHWPGDQDVSLTHPSSMDAGDACNLTSIAMNAHTGTHMDAPYHFVNDGARMDQLPLNAVIGRARVIEIDDPVAIRAVALRPHRLKKGERILFKTRNSARCWPQAHFVEDFVYISRGAAEYLAECCVRTVGIDYLSVGGFRQDGLETHQALLSAGIWVIEGLDLSAVSPGDYKLICLPLKLVGVEGAPARAALKPQKR